MKNTTTDPLVQVKHAALEDALRRSRFLNVTEFSRAAGVTDQSIWNVLKPPAHRAKRVARVRASRAERMAFALGIHVAEIVEVAE